MSNRSTIPGTGVIIGRTVAIIFVVEAIVMLGIWGLDIPLSGPTEAFFDAAALSLLSTPLLFFWAIKPFVEASTRSAAALRSSEQHLLAAQRVARVGSWRFEHRTQRLTWSDEVFRIFEADRGAFEGSYEAFLSRIHRDDRERVDHAFMDSVASGTAYQVEHRIMLDDGRIKHVCERGETSYDGEGNALVSTGTVVDITAQVEAQQQIEKERRKAQNYLDVANAMIIALDRQGCVTMANPMCCRLLAMPEQQLLGRDWIDAFFVDEEKAGMKKLFDDVMQGKDRLPETHENWIRTADGRELLIAWHNSLLRDSDGEILGTLSSGHDITETRRAEQALLRSQQETEQALEQLSTLSLQLQTEAARRQQFESRVTNLAEIDSLTQLPIRSALKHELRQWKEQADAGALAGLVSVKLCGVSTVNRLRGLEVGDAAIVEAALRIQEAAGGDARVYRSHGVEFTLVAPRIGDENELQPLLEALRESMRQPLESLAGEVLEIRLRSRVCELHDDAIDRFCDQPDWQQGDANATGRATA